MGQAIRRYLNAVGATSTSCIGVWTSRVLALMAMVRPRKVEVVVRATHRWARFEVDGRRVQHTSVFDSLRRHALTILDRLRIRNRVLVIGGRVDDVHSGVRGLAGGIDAVDGDGIARNRVDDAVDAGTLTRPSGRWCRRRALAAFRRADRHGLRSDRRTRRTALRGGLDIDATTRGDIGHLGWAELGDHCRRREVHRSRRPIPLRELDPVARHRSDQALDLVMPHGWCRRRRGLRSCRACRRAGFSGVFVARIAASGERHCGGAGDREDHQLSQSTSLRGGGHHGSPIESLRGGVPTALPSCTTIS
jgi:hypothetical protein